AVAHGDAGTGYRPTSEAMVNIRVTLRAAEASGVVGHDAARRIEAIAKGLFYPDRAYPKVFALALEEGVDAEAVASLRRFVASRRLDVKHDDAIALLEALDECRALGVPPPPPRFGFAHTEAWEQ